jgi:type IV pilus assembly protein PilC
MPLFDYTGQLLSGAAFQGTLEAADQQVAEDMLAEMGVRVTSIRPTQRTAYVAPLSLEEFTFFNEQLSTLTRVGVPLEEGLRQLASDVGSKKLKRLLLDLADELHVGATLEEALARHAGRFPAHYDRVVEAGLQTGDLGGTLAGLTTHLRLKSSARRAMVELVAYPLLVLTIAMVVATFIMMTVVPVLHELAQEIRLDMGWGLSAPATSSDFLYGLAHVWPTIVTVFVALLALGAILWTSTYLRGGGRWREALVRRVPGFSQVYWSSVLARFAHTSALAAHAGRPLPEMITAAGTASGSPALARATALAAEELTAGTPLQQAADAQRDIPALWTCAVSVAGPRGDLPGALAELARTYEARAEQWVLTLRHVLGPLLFLVIAFGIGGLVVSIVVAVARLMQSLMSWC